uniref:Glutathione-S-transferase epsilon class n=1 Tax=Spodoptera littoralis TaxID=7109 RepID=A0A3G1ZLA6_SPOLI|nr:glutathione-S-transferase epsilon class [Spodoptera littoralis]
MFSQYFDHIATVTMVIRIYKKDASPPARAVLMAAEIINLKCEIQDVDLSSGPHLSPEYLEKNTLHSVPFLEDGDFYLADSHAIITYLVSKYGAEHRSKWYPCDLSVRATVDQRMYFDTSDLFPHIKNIVSVIVTQGVGPDAEQIKAINAGYEVLDKYLQKTKFVAANHMTLADVSCVASVSSLNVLCPVDSKYAYLLKWWDTLKEEKWYKKANEPGLAKLEAYVKSKWNK